MLLDLTTDTRHSADSSALELGNLKRRREHALDECCVLENLHQCAKATICSDRVTDYNNGWSDDVDMPP